MSAAPGSIKAEVQKDISGAACKTCSFLAAQGPDRQEWSEILAAPLVYPHAAVARTIKRLTEHQVSESSIKRHRVGGHTA